MANSIRLYLSLLETPRFFLYSLLWVLLRGFMILDSLFMCYIFALFLWMYCVDTFIYIWFPSRHQIIYWDLIIISAFSTMRSGVPNPKCWYWRHSHFGLVWKVYDLGFFLHLSLISEVPFGTYIRSYIRLCSNLVVSLRHQNRVVLSWDDIVILSRVNVSGILFCYHCSIWTSINLF